MSPSWRSALRSVVIVAGLAVTVASVLAFRIADWPIYVVFVLVSLILFLPYVEALPGVPLPIPEMAATIGFLYIAGLPIIILSDIAPLLIRLLRWALPARWKDAIPQLRVESGAARGQLSVATWGSALADAGVSADMAMATLGLAVRWWVVTALVSGKLPARNAAAIAVAEVAGYACWGLLAILPIYPDRPLLALTSGGGMRTALTDIGLVIVLALTPFVFLIFYGFQVHGLPGAAAWSLSALGLHFMLKRLNQRRLRVEEQNRRLEALNRELEHRERLSAIGKMSSVVSHQILQQLGVIGIYADLIRHAAAADDPAVGLAQSRDNAAAIETALRDVNRVLTDLLVFSKDLRLNLYAHPLNRVIEESVEECRAQANERRVTLRSTCPGEISLTLDKLKMKQALANIVRNAIEVSPPGGEVLLSAQVRDGNVEVAVADRGPGVPERDREAVFTPFFTTKEHGTGLGLAIAHQFTEAHGGQLRVEPRPDGPGATFILRLPLDRS